MNERHTLYPKLTYILLYKGKVYGKCQGQGESEGEGCVSAVVECIV